MGSGISAIGGAVSAIGNSAAASSNVSPDQQGTRAEAAAATAVAGAAAEARSIQGTGASSASSASSNPVGQWIAGPFQPGGGLHSLAQQLQPGIDQARDRPLAFAAGMWDKANRAGAVAYVLAEFIEAASGGPPMPGLVPVGGEVFAPPVEAAPPLPAYLAEKAAENAILPRYNGPKPGYDINPAHVPGQGLRAGAGKTPLPADAEQVFEGAVPNDPSSPTAWFGKNSSGQIYRYSLGNNGTAHFSGIDGVGDGVRNLTQYASDRLNGL